jgi:hypothetical protein
MNPDPELNHRRYERPNQKWVCGRAGEGQICRAGPDPKGHCGATFECVPSLVLKEGETKGSYRCMRPEEFGGRCQIGPLPIGRCSRPIPRCQPLRSLRARRGMFTVALFSATVAILLILLNGSARFHFINPGPISSVHSGARFRDLHQAGGAGSNSCAACHKNATLSSAGWVGSIFSSGNGLIQPISDGVPGITMLDKSCLGCHIQHNFHRANVLKSHSCSVCHQEHKGDAALNAVPDTRCADCHNDGESMRAAFDKAELGPTLVFAVFANGHPDFRVHTSMLKETNTLKFNHQRHFSDDIPLVNGKKLDCVFCHRPASVGGNHQAPQYELSCKPCHLLQFDSRNPLLEVPHGDVLSVRAFLRSLPDQYLDYAKRVLGLVNQRELDAFVHQQLTALRGEMHSDENLEAKVFLSTDRWAPGEDSARLGSGSKTAFQGCALCHEVIKAGDDPPVLTHPLIKDHWFAPGTFDHSKHASLDCRQCHDAERSRETSDIILPSVSGCVNCHSPTGGVEHSCASCHTFHGYH